MCVCVFVFLCEKKIFPFKQEKYHTSFQIGD